MKIFGRLVLFFLVFQMIISSCSQTSDVKIGFLIPATEGSRWVIDKKFVEKAAQDRNAEIIVRSAENDENLQLRQAEELIEQGVDVLIVVPSNANTAAAIVRDGHDAGIPVIAYDRLIKNCELDYLVTFEGEKIGELMIEHAFSKVPKGNYVVLWGDASDVNAISIKAAQEKMLEPHIANGDINVVYKTFIENWSKEIAYKAMKKVLTLSDKKIDAVITSYDGLALGALQAIEEEGIETVKVLTGQDAELDAVRAIVNGKMSLTVYKSIKETASAAVDLGVTLAKGEKPEKAKATIFNGRADVPMLLLQPAAVEKSTIATTVIADQFYTEEQVYGE